MMDGSDDRLSPEFSVIVALDSIGDEPREYEISASPDEMAALTARFGIVSIDKCDARLVLTWLKPGKVLSVQGRFAAHVTQSCVISLDPVSAELDKEFDIIYSRNPDETADIVDPNDAEALEGETVDIGEIVSEELSLSLDPYPRRPDIDPASEELGPGARFLSEEAADQDSRETAKKSNPFEVLARLKPND